MKTTDGVRIKKNCKYFAVIGDGDYFPFRIRSIKCTKHDWSGATFSIIGHEYFNRYSHRPNNHWIFQNKTNAVKRVLKQLRGLKKQLINSLGSTNIKLSNVNQEIERHSQ